MFSIEFKIGRTVVDDRDDCLVFEPCLDQLHDRGVRQWSILLLAESAGREQQETQTSYQIPFMSDYLSPASLATVAQAQVSWCARWCACSDS
jgi:hypothetical protein